MGKRLPFCPATSIQIYPRYFTPERHHMQTGWDLWRSLKPRY
jgi:hypothetical protein